MPRGHVLPDRDTIATLRGEAGLTQQGLADRTGYGVRTISKIESGQATSASTLAAIAIVLAESLERPIHLVDLICQANGSGRGWHAGGGTAIVAEQIRLLDLERAVAATSAGMSDGAARAAVMIDTFRLRYVPGEWDQIDFPYRSTPGRISGRSLSHPADCRWLSAADGAMSSRGRISPGEDCLLRINLSTLAKRPVVVQNEIKLVDAFGRPEARRIETEIFFPTDQLTVLVRFPADRPATALTGRTRRTPGGPLLPMAEQPIDLAAGRMAYWRIAAPTPGEAYQLQWT